MKTSIPNRTVTCCKALIIGAMASFLFNGCAAPTKPDPAANVRSKLTQLQSDPQLASRAPLAIKDADLAVRAAEETDNDPRLLEHLVLVADLKVDTAWAQAQKNLLEDQRKTLSEERERARLDARTREADIAKQQVFEARTDAEMARNEADAARAAAAQLQNELNDLQAKATDRGMVVTLGDVLFETGRADLKGGATSNLSKLAAFLNRYPDRAVIIEGHTDNIGSTDYNQNLSQHRADAVKSYLVLQGIAPSRLTAMGMGEDSPVSSNESATGRQQNRRVEVIIENPPPSP